MSRKELIDEFLDSLDNYMNRFIENKESTYNEDYYYSKIEEEAIKKELAESLEKLLNYSKED